MSWHIYAWLEAGRPRLQVTEAGTENPVLDWTCRSSEGEQGVDPCELKRLFRELILLSCRQEAANVRVFELNA